MHGGSPFDTDKRTSQGFGNGRGGSPHLQWMAAGALGTNAIVGGGAPMATGNAWAVEPRPGEALDADDGTGAVKVCSPVAMPRWRAARLMALPAGAANPLGARPPTAAPTSARR